MAAGGYALKVQGADEVAAALKASGQGVRDLSRINTEIAHRAHMKVAADAPVYKGQNSMSKKPAHGSTARFEIMDSIKDSHGPKRASVSAGGQPYFFIQEFGGTSYWYRGGGGGALRKLGGHFGVEAGGGYLSVGRASVRGHVIYRKPRKSRGYFIWNVAYRLRSFIGNTYMKGLDSICTENGLDVDFNASADLDLDAKTSPR